MDQNIKIDTEIDTDGSDQIDAVCVDDDDDVSMKRTTMWRVLGRRVPKDEIVFCSQISVVLIVVSASIYNLSVGSKNQSEMWTALLSSCLGYILPNPRLKSD